MLSNNSKIIHFIYNKLNNNNIQTSKSNTPLSITYSSLLNLINTNNLTINNTYLINDFQTIYDQPDFNSDGTPKINVSTLSGSIEPLIVTAISTNNLSQVASSTLSTDIIHYDPFFIKTEIMEAPAKGRITLRIDSNNNITNYDSKAIVFKRYQTTPVSGIYTIINDNGNGSVNNIPTFGNNNYNIKILNFYPDVINIAGPFSFILSNNIFGEGCNNITTGNYFYNNTFGIGCYGNTFGNICYNNLIGYSFFYNIIGNNFNTNIIGNNFKNNNIVNGFRENPDPAVPGFENNEIGDNFRDNNILSGFRQNTIVCTFIHNNISYDFQSNEIGTTQVGIGFENNVIGTGFYSNKTENGFFRNTSRCAVLGTGATISILTNPELYATYDAEILQMNDNNVYSGYVDSVSQLWKWTLLVN
jgi:hypothetical protein